MDHEHVLALVEAIHGANFHAVHVLALDAILDDDVGHVRSLGQFDAMVVLAALTLACKIAGRRILVRAEGASSPSGNGHNRRADADAIEKIHNVFVEHADAAVRRGRTDRAPHGGRGAVDRDLGAVERQRPGPIGLEGEPPGIRSGK